METSLHRELKQLYASSDDQIEVRMGPFIIDAIADGELVEIQHGSLGAIRDKCRTLLKDHQLRVIKPIVARRQLVKLTRKNGRVKGRRLSPKRGTILDLFHELIYFTKVFPHPNLYLDVILVDIEEWRYPKPLRKRRWRRPDFKIQDQLLVEIRERRSFHTTSDLLELIPTGLSTPFHTGHLAEAMGVQRWFAQRITYALREIKAISAVGKQGNARLYKIRRTRQVKKAG
jgi:hypothetical protein